MWTLIYLLPNKHAIVCRWSTRLKQNSMGHFSSIRLGLSCRQGIQTSMGSFRRDLHFYCKNDCIQTFIFVAAIFHQPSYQMDVNNAFLNDFLNEVYHSSWSASSSSYVGWNDHFMGLIKLLVLCMIASVLQLRALVTSEAYEWRSPGSASEK